MIRSLIRESVLSVSIAWITPDRFLSHNFDPQHHRLLYPNKVTLFHVVLCSLYFGCFVVFSTYNFTILIKRILDKPI